MKKNGNIANTIIEKDFRFRYRNIKISFKKSKQYLTNK